MSIQFRCDQCGREYDLPDMTAGKKAKCECGVLLVVPTATQAIDATDTFDPAAPDEPPASAAPKPPRTLAVAAKQAAPPPPPAPPAEPKPEPPPVAPTPPAAVAEMPPPLPPAYQVAAASAEPEPPLEKRYRNLRAYCGWLRLVGWLVLVGTALTVFVGLAGTIPPIINAGASPVVIVTMLLPSLTGGAFGVTLFVLVNAAAELFQVLMDIEENTRPR